MGRTLNRKTGHSLKINRTVSRHQLRMRRWQQMFPARFPITSQNQEWRWGDPLATLGALLLKVNFKNRALRPCGFSTVLDVMDDQGRALRVPIPRGLPANGRDVFCGRYSHVFCSTMLKTLADADRLSWSTTTVANVWHSCTELGVVIQYLSTRRVS